MKKSILVMIALCVCGNMQAQGFLNKLKKAATVTSAATSAATTQTSVSDADEDTGSISWENVPVYSAQQVTVTNEDGTPVLNEDGTPVVKVFLVDQNGNRRSAETVKAQQKKLNNSILAILAKVGGGAVLGAVAGGGEGAIAGGVAGAVASIDDVKNAKAMKKSLKEQKKLLEAYEMNFTAEGDLKDASVDLSKIDGLDLKPENNISLSTSAIKEELENGSHDPKPEDWEF